MFLFKTEDMKTITRTRKKKELKQVSQNYNSTQFTSCKFLAIFISHPDENRNSAGQKPAL
jgi:hypothetical protein